MKRQHTRNARDQRSNSDLMSELRSAGHGCGSMSQKSGTLRCTLTGLNTQSRGVEIIADTAEEREIR